MSRVMVTVDDGGLHPAVNRAARRCMEEGVVHRYSILPTGPCAEEACADAMAAGVPLSAHLDGVSGPFLGGGGGFPRGLAEWGMKAGKLAPRLREEWCAQVERLLSWGAMLTGLDSHRHLHHLPALQEVFLSIASEYGIRWVRTAVLPDRYARFPLGLFLDALGRRLHEHAFSRGLSASSFLLGFGAAGCVGEGYLRRYLPKDGRASVELVMHPAVEPVWSRHQPGELAFMLSRGFRKWVE